VFIIDEINRGEMSKIFGELFFSIDPGYRGKDGMVKTQYQNLIEPSDDFYQGFYVPNNVYIIGTMNDIDRSVECMDFAMRRRFAFIEIFAEDNTNMLDGIKEKDVIIEKMKAINEIITSEEELGSSYHIGGAYFKKVDLCRDKDNNIDWRLFWDRYLRRLVFEYVRGLQNKPDLLRMMEAAIV
jgi:5-methylcytosine-specific restriction protein B